MGRREERENEEGRGGGRGRKRREKKNKKSLSDSNDLARFGRFDLGYMKLNFFYSALEPKKRSKNLKTITENSKNLVESKYIFKFITWSLN